MINAANCPIYNLDWYDVTDVAMSRKGKNAKLCVNLDCHEDCNRIITSNGYPPYDADGSIANSLYQIQTASSKAEWYTNSIAGWNFWAVKSSFSSLGICPVLSNSATT